jgi:hypothetical protein
MPPSIPSAPPMPPALPSQPRLSLAAVPSPPEPQMSAWLPADPEKALCKKNADTTAIRCHVISTQNAYTCVLKTERNL